MSIRARNLDVVANTEVQREIRSDFPVVLRKHAGLPPAIRRFDGITDVDEVCSAKKETGCRMAGSSGNGDRLAVGKAGAVQCRLSGLECDATSGQSALIALQPAHLSAKGECVMAANECEIVIDDVTILSIERGTSRSDAVLRGTDSNLRVGAVETEWWQSFQSQRIEARARLQRPGESRIANKSDVGVVQQGG